MRFVLVMAVLVMAASLAPLSADEKLGLSVRSLAGIPVPPLTHGLDRPEDALPDGRPGTGDNDIALVWLIAPTRRYGHGILGDELEAGGLRVFLRDGRVVEYLLGEDSVFEDLMPRLVDLDGDGRDEVVVVRTYLKSGAALAVFGLRDGRLVLLAETPPIGRPNRWLNPVGAGDFDGDGKIEIAYVETPHIGGTLRIFSLQGG